jgi:hypothetical protein
MTKYVAIVNKSGAKEVIVAANSVEEATEKVAEVWGKDAVLGKPELPQPGQIESILEADRY